jgi:hypothetical protein
VSGRLAALRRGWLRRLGWYPGDWVWISLLTLLVAAGGAAVSIWLTANGSGAATTVVAPPPPPAPTRPAAPTTTGRPKPARAGTAKTTTGGTATGRTTTATTATGRTTTATSTTRPAPAAPPNGQTPWPAGRNGWTLVLVSYPTAGGRAVPAAAAARAARAGLPQVGVLESAEYASLHPGYYVVFSGIYSSQAEAEAALPSARAAGFGAAYTRQISR